MRALFFGHDEEPLFGVYHPARRSAATGRAVVLCQPIGHEYPNAHRSIRLLAGLLAKGGAHALRFDYYGSGDSWGDSGAGGVPRWLDDIGAAVDQLRALGAPSAVDIVGLRFGGALAALYAARDPAVGRLVLWDPVVDGRAYLEELMGVASVYDSGGGAEDDVVGVAGYPFPARMRAEIADVGVREAITGVAPKTGLVVSGGTAHEAAVRASGLDTEALAAYEVAEGRDWLAPHQPGMIPQPQMAWIARFLGGR